MGRSTASCFKIITCADPVDATDDVEAPEGKGSSQRGWSFRKRSARHRVLSNTVVTETSSSSYKESPQTATANLQTQPNPTSLEKTSAIPWTEEIPLLPASVNTKVCDTRVASEDDKLHHVNPDESVIVVIQASIRGFLAQKEMVKLKNVVKLQAAVRGHLVRRHAVGTLRCVQAIIKLQALVRARRARLLSEGSCTEGVLDGGHGKDKHSSQLLEKGNSVTKPMETYISIEKLLSNKFAHQLLESTPRTKRIHIKCDPSRSDSAWKWLERWMSVSSMEVEQPQKPEAAVEQQDQDKETGFAAEDCELTDINKTNTTGTLVLSKGDENLITSNSSDFEFQACQPSSSAKSENLEPPLTENANVENSKESSLELISDQTTQLESISQMEFNPISSKPELEKEQATSSLKRFAPEQVETEGKKFAFGMRKATNPAFIAVQSKFEELSSSATSVRSTNSNNKDVAVESYSDSISSTREVGPEENSVLHNLVVKVGRSESGTELSISSTLDSPYGSENGAMDVEHKAEDSEVGTSNLNSSKHLDIEADCETTITEADISYSNVGQPEKLDDGAMSESANSVAPGDSLQENVKSEPTTYDGGNGEPFNSSTAVDSLQENRKSEANVQIEPELVPGHHTDKSSPEASPRNHMADPEVQETPSSQVSVKGDKTRSGKRGSSRKRRSLAAGKQSPSNPNHDSGSKDSLEKLDKDHKTGKRRNSFGSGRPEDVDQEPRESNCSNSIPSYMQATESARAKALAASSPKSSPDVHDKEIYVKKRHSLPGANGRQGSPRVQRSSSRSQQGAKGNGPHGIFLTTSCSFKIV
ncbi:protein IQ-DOMAIN 32 isoform X1 [Rhododendron vialii]|uniref:protein IQ-DOMAIN 32 isoform X1 n=1 Tax=Rhododendron vialii TaxID=182163 RepID=UPI002660356E|nr:protein IQ-DOMAIN 32 isoform X1 [Rhododendron vialii]